MARPQKFDFVIVGSGFGGAVAAARLSEAGFGVLLLERGRAWSPGSFPRGPSLVESGLWDPGTGLHGMFDRRSFRTFEALVASGLGGGSLIYGNALIRKDERWFVTEDRSGDGYESWPVTRSDLDPHYDRVEKALKAHPYPLAHPPYHRTSRTQALRAAASDLGLDWHLPPLAVAFANDGEAPVPGVPIREARPNLHGRMRQTCRLCGECVIGCNYGSKNTLDFTYLTAAAARGAELRTLCEVNEIVPAHDGSWTVSYVRHSTLEDATPQHMTVTAGRLVLSAGTFGTLGILMRSREALPGLSGSLGRGFSTNGNLLSLAVRGETPLDPAAPQGEAAPVKGPVITCSIRMPGAPEGSAGHERGGYIEDVGYPELAQSEEASRLLLLLAMGRDVPDGVVSLVGDRLEVDWDPEGGSQAYFAGARRVVAAVGRRLGGSLETPWLPGSRPIVVHPLGGARMATMSQRGVVDPWGRVYNCPNLYVMDGSVLPGPVGANPALTIAALADRFCDRIIEDAAASVHRGAGGGTAADPDAIRVAVLNLDGILGLVPQLSGLAGQHEGDLETCQQVLGILRKAGLAPLLLSGGPHELVAHLATTLGVPLLAGADRLAQLVGGDRPICWSESLVVAHGRGDTDLLRRAGHPFVLEPAPDFANEAREAGWYVADRRNLATMLQARLGMGQGSTPPDNPRPARPRDGKDAQAALKESKERLNEYIAGLVGEDGAVSSECQSRVTESALLLALLRREGLLPGLQATLRSYLVRSAPGAAPFDGAVIDALLKGVTIADPDSLIDRVLASAFHGGDRDRVVLSAVLAAVAGTPFTRLAGPEAFDPEGHGSSLRLWFLAGRILRLSEYGPVTGPEVDDLLTTLERGHPGAVWERQVFAHALALTALSRARPGHPAIRRGVGALLECQRGDGGLPFLAGKENFTTAAAGRALARSGGDARVIDAMAACLARHQASDGGWSLAPGVGESDVDSTAFSVIFLHQVSSDRYAKNTGLARAFLDAAVLPDGGVPLSPSGEVSDPWMTAIAVAALATHGFAFQSTLACCARYLINAQRPDGTFARSWSLSEGAPMSASVLALNAMSHHSPASLRPALHAAITRAQRRLLSTVNADGGWGHSPVARSDPISSAYSLMALTPNHLDSPPVRRGIRYLLSRQRADGSFIGPPDQVGPRPLPYSIPALGNAFILLGLSYLDR